MDELDMEFEILPELTPQQQKQLEKEQMNRLKKFYTTTQEYAIERWYKPLANFTFSSFSFPLTNIEGYLLTCLYHEDENILKRPQIQQAKNNLKEKVDIFLQKHFPEGCFMKLSTRSPKDVGWRYQDESTIKQHVQRLTKLLEGTKDLNKQARNKIYRYFLQQSKHKVKINSADDFIQIFSQSQRIQIDLNDLAYINNGAFSKLQQGDYSVANQKLIDIWGREWVNCNWMQEFRCFFNNYKLTAVCQYDQRCYFPELKGQQQNVMKKINTFFDKIKPRLNQINMEKGVIDLIVKFDEESPVILIQINVFDHNSRASLFHWQKDLKIILNGPLQFRIHNQEIQISKYQLSKMMGMVEKGIQNVLKQVMKRLNLQEQWQKLQ